MGLFWVSNFEVPNALTNLTLGKTGVLGDPKKYSHSVKHQTIGFCSITSMYLDSQVVKFDENS